MTTLEVTDEADPRYEGWRVVVACGLGVFLSTVFFYSFGVFVKPLSQEFGWSRQSVSSAYGALAMGAAVSAPFLGRLLDWLGSKRILVPCAILSSCAFASLAALTPRLWHLWGVFAVMGVGAAGTSILAYSRVIPGWFDRRRGLALAVVMSTAALGAIAHPVAAERLIGAAGWRAAYLVLGAFVLAIEMATIVWFVRERKASTDRAAVARAAGVPARDALRSRAFWLLLIVLLGGTMVSQGTIVHLPAMMSDRGSSPSDAALAVSVVGAATLAGRLVTGWLIDRFLATRVACGLVLTAAVGTFLLAGAESWWAGAAGAALIGFGAGGESDIAPYLLSRYFGLRSVSTLYGVVWAAVGCGAAAVPVLMARSFDRTGSYEPALVALGAATLAVAGVALLLPAYEVPRA